MGCKSFTGVSSATRLGRESAGADSSFVSGIRTMKSFTFSCSLDR
jgi:hypothetical protein